MNLYNIMIENIRNFEKDREFYFRDALPEELKKIEAHAAGSLAVKFNKEYVPALAERIRQEYNTNVYKRV